MKYKIEKEEQKQQPGDMQYKVVGIICSKSE